MADDSKVWVENQKIVQRIHQKLKKEISEIAKAKSWSAEKTQAFEKNLLELYNDVIEETVKSNVSVNGTEWVDEPKETQTETTIQSVQEPVNKARLKEVNAMWSSLEDSIRETTSKRKKYPPIITGAMNNILQSKLQLLETYSPAAKSEAMQHSKAENKQDETDCIQRLQDVMEEQAELVKVLPALQSKVGSLQAAILTHKGMEASETDAVLFSKTKSVTPASSRRTTRLLRTPDRYTSPGKTRQSGKKPSLRDSLLDKSLNHSYKKT